MIARVRQRIPRPTGDRRHELEGRPTAANLGVVAATAGIGGALSAPGRECYQQLDKPAWQPPSERDPLGGKHEHAALPQVRHGLIKREFLAAAATAGAGSLLLAGRADAAEPSSLAMTTVVTLAAQFNAPMIVGPIPGGLRTVHVTSAGTATGMVTGPIAAGGISWNLGGPRGTQMDYTCW